MSLHRFRSRWLASLSSLAIGLLLAAGVAGTATASPPTPLVRAGAVPGPVAVAGGNTKVQVAHLDLTAGNWTVFAKAELDNTTAALLTLRPTNCVLLVGTASQLVSATPLGAGSDSSRQPFLLTVAAHLNAAGHASLRCSAPGSATGAIKIKGIRMIAFQTTGLTLAEQHHVYTYYGPPNATSHVYQVNLVGSVAIDSASDVDVADMVLPHGNWAVTATGSLYATGASGTTVTCTTTAGFDNDATFTTLGPVNTVTDRRGIVGQLVHTYGAGGGTVRFACASGSTSNGTRIRQVRLTAYRADVLQNQNVGVDDTYPSEPATANPLVVGGWIDGPIHLSNAAGLHTVADEKLHPGTWVVVAKGWLEQTAASAALVHCQLGTASAHDAVDLMLPGVYTVDNNQFLDLAWYGTLTATTKVALSCHIPGGAVDAHRLKLTAYRVGTLQRQGLR
jgi:hypothetical protein